MKNFADSCLKKLADILKIQNMNSTGPFFNAFAFEDNLSEKESFAPATTFLPKWHVFSDSGIMV